MRKNTITNTLATAAAATLIVSGCSQGSSSHDSHGGSESGSSQASAQFNDADVTYAEGMIMHHQQAVEMSDIILDKSGVNPDVVEMAKQIKKAQGPEIKEMQTWLKDWGQDDSGHEGHGGDSGSGDEMGHDGMVSPEDIKKLKAADGEQASTLFLDQMIEHHQGAVKMAKDHRQDGENPDAVELSQNVISDQNAEIKEMRTMRTSL